MPEGNVDLVLRAYEAWNLRDFDAVIELIDPEVEWSFFGATRFPGVEASFRGHEGVREFWRTFVEPWDDITIEIESTRELGDTVIAFVIFHAKAREGMELDAPFAHLLQIRDGKCVRFSAYDDPSAALEAAGSSG